MKAFLLSIVILLSVTEIKGQPLRPREIHSNPLDHIKATIQKLPVKEIIALKISYGRKILINCNTLFVTEVTDIPRNDNLIRHQLSIIYSRGANFVSRGEINCF